MPGYKTGIALVLCISAYETNAKGGSICSRADDKHRLRSIPALRHIDRERSSVSANEIQSFTGLLQLRCIANYGHVRAVGWRLITCYTLYFPGCRFIKDTVLLS